MGQQESATGRAIITYSRGWQSLGAARSLGRRGVEVITGDEYAMTQAAFSKYSIADFRYPSPGNEPEAFLDALEEAVLKHKPKNPDTPYVLMPIHKETYLIAKHRERFEPHIKVPVPKFDQIMQVHNKGTLAASAMARGLSIPRTWLPKSIAEFEAMSAEIALPAFIKLRDSAAGVGIKKVESLNELKETFHDFIERYGVESEDYPIIQQGVPGDDYCVTTLFDHGHLLMSMTYRNIRQYPPTKGAGVLRETVKAERMEAVAREVLGPMGWHGVAELDFRWTGKEGDEPYLIEVNPRFWGGLMQAIESGWDYPWHLYRLAAEGHIEPPQQGRYDVRTETPLIGLLATLQELSENDHRLDELKNTWRKSMAEFKDGSKRAGLKQLFSGLKDYVDLEGRAEEAQTQFEVHKNSVYELLSKDDPLPVLGLLYPIAVFMKHGKVNMDLLVSEGEVKGGRRKEEG